MDYTTLVAKSKENQEQPVKRMQSLYEVCQEVVDGRCARGKRVSRWQACWWCWCWQNWQACRAYKGQVTGSRISKLSCARDCTCRGNACRVPIPTVMRLPRLDSQKVNTALAAWCVRKEAQSRCGEEPSRLVAHPSEQHAHLAMDGKVVRGTGKQAYGGKEPQKQVLHGYEVQTGMVLRASSDCQRAQCSQYPQAEVLRGAVQRTHSHQRCGPELSRVWTAGQACRRRGGGVRQRQSASHSCRPGTLL